MAILRTDELTMQFGGLTAVDKLSVSVDEREIVGLIGPNGAGKTTAFNMITGVYAPTHGSVFFENHDITGSKPHQITKRGVARTFQNIRLFKELSVLDNVIIANHLRLKSTIFGSVFKSPFYRKEEAHIYDKSIELLEQVGLTDVLHDRSSSLPYGKQRRLEIARALATDPKLLLLDEPAAGMNPQESMELMAFIREIRDTFDVGILMIEHHMKVIMGVCEKIYVLDHGETIAKGNPAEIQNNPKVIEAYLGVD